MSPTSNYGGAAADSGGSNQVWTPTSGALPASTDWPGGGESSNNLNVTDFGFAIPSTATILGIAVTVNGSGFSAAYGGISLSIGGVSLGFGDNFIDTTFGNSTDLWGNTTITPSQVNSSSFGVSIGAYNTHGGGDATVDSVQITIYWQTGPANVQPHFLYKVFASDGTPLGVLPNVTSDYQCTQNINTAGSQVTIVCAVSPDTLEPIAALGESDTYAPIKDGNRIEIWKVDYWNPNGKCRFLGEIKRWEADFGDNSSDSDTYTILAYSDGSDLNNYIVRGSPYTYTSDVTQGASNVFGTIDAESKGAAFQAWGQTWKVGTGVTNLGAINLALDGSANVTISVYTSAALTTFLGSVTQYVSTAGEQVVQFAFPTEITTTPAATLFFTVTVDAGDSILIATQNTAVYANGTAYYQSYDGGGGGGYYAITGDLYFETFSGVGTTLGLYTDEDPSTGILIPLLNDYISRGGIIDYETTNIEATGLSLSYQFQTNTTYEGINDILSISPNGFYWYVDLGTDQLYFQQANDVADITLVKGKTIQTLDFVATIEQIKNQAFVSGGIPSGDTENIFVTYSDPTSIADYGVNLDRISQTGILDDPTATAVAQADVEANSSEQRQSQIVILNTMMDTSTLKPGMMVSCIGYQNFVDGDLQQIVQIQETGDQVTLTTGILPIRLTSALEQTAIGVIALASIANPSSAS